VLNFITLRQEPNAIFGLSVSFLIQKVSKMNLFSVILAVFVAQNDRF